jgi:hypothetical protein
VCSRSGLFLLKKTSGIEFSPAPTTALSAKQKASIYSFINAKTKYLAYSPSLGWTIKRNGRLGIYQANSQGIRASEEYPLIPEQGVLRISSFGDSYTHCDDVKNSDTWQARMEAANEGMQVLNFGVPAYGLDQAFLRYCGEGPRYNPHVVLIGFMSENINRHVNTFRPFYVPSPFWPFSKPRFSLKDDKLLFLKNPMDETSRYYDLLENPSEVLPRLGENDFHFNRPTRHKQGPVDFLSTVRLAKMAAHEFMKFGRQGSAIIRDGRYNLESEAYWVTVKLFDEFVSRVEADGSLPVIVILPNQEDVVQYRESGTKVYAPLLEHFEERGYSYIDVTHVLDTYGADLATEDLVSDLFLQDPSVHRSFHYSPSTNGIVAGYIIDYLEREGLASVGEVKRKLKGRMAAEAL